jgi:hypothetical protein
MKRQKYGLVIIGLFVLFSCAPNDMVFSVMGDVPRSEQDDALLQKQIIAHNKYSPSEFMFHVGDIKTGGQPCDEAVYAKVSGFLQKLSIPTIMLPGDNEWNDCDNSAQAWNYWQQYFMRFDQNWSHKFKIQQQETRPENVSFIHNKVLFIGINLVGGTVHDEGEWASMMSDAVEWIKFQFEKNHSKVYSAVLFAQAHPKEKHKPFTQPFLGLCKEFGKPVLFIHGDGHRWEHVEKWNEENVTRVQIDQGGIALPLQVTVSPKSEKMFTFNRTAFELE